MPEPPPLPSEALRLAHLEQSGLAMLTRVPALDPFVEEAASLLAADIAAVAILHEHEQVFVSTTGLTARRGPRASGICTHALAQPSRALTIPDARYDPRTMDSPLVLGPPYIRAYAGKPLCLVDGIAVGTLCACALAPRNFSADQMRILDRLADAATAILFRMARRNGEDIAAPHFSIGRHPGSRSGG